MLVNTSVESSWYFRRVSVELFEKKQQKKKQQKSQIRTFVGCIFNNMSSCTRIYDLHHAESVRYVDPGGASFNDIVRVYRNVRKCFWARLTIRISENREWTCTCVCVCVCVAGGWNTTARTVKRAANGEVGEL